MNAYFYLYSGQQLAATFCTMLNRVSLVYYIFPSPNLIPMKNASNSETLYFELFDRLFS